MSTLTLGLPADKHERIRRLAAIRGVSMSRLVDEWASTALAQLEAEAEFRAHASRGNSARGLALLDLADAAERKARPRNTRIR